jgi:hypothetical protein
MGSQWQNERYELVARRYADLMRLCIATGLQGATIFGEVSSFSTVNEINYLAFARFACNSNLTWEQFIKQDLAPILGGVDAAQQYLNFLVCEASAKSLQNALEMSREIASDQSGEIYRRWLWLQHRLSKKLFSLQ